MFGNKTHNELAEIKAQIWDIKTSLNEIHCKFFQRYPQYKCNSDDCEESEFQDLKGDVEEIKETIRDFFDTTEENNTFNLIHEKLNKILNDERRLEKVQLAQSVSDKFDDYMDNIEKLNKLVNEIKGLAVITRANLKATKKPKNKD